MDLKKNSVPKKQGLDFFIIQKEKSQLGFFSFRLQIASRYGQDPEQNRVDADLYSLKFQNLKNIRSN